MKLPFLKQLQRLTGLPTHELVIEDTGPGSESSGVEQALQHLLAELPDLLMAAVVNTETGKAAGLYTTERGLRPDLVAGFNAEAVRQVRAALVAQQATDEVVRELLFTLRSQVHVVHLSASGQQFLYLAADSHDTNLALAREVMRSASGLLEPTAPH